jgi:curved DNA-binding protein CbpA
MDVGTVKPLSEQDHYEVLEVSRDASREGVERAYKLARATYTEDGLAGYSVFADGDAEAIRERIELAYRVLSDPETRIGYDSQLSDKSVAEPIAVPIERPPPLTAIEEFEDLEEGPDYDGARLRRARMRRGLELDEVASVTKVSPAYLRFLEEERFGELPARVYVRGFVMAFADCVGLEPATTAAGYMQLYDSQTEPQRLGR